LILDGLVKSHLQATLSSFGKRLKLKLPGKENNQFLAGQIEPGVKNCKLFEGVSPSSCNLAGINLNPKNAHRANKILLFTSSSFFNGKNIYTYRLFVLKNQFYNLQ